MGHAHHNPAGLNADASLRTGDTRLLARELIERADPRGAPYTMLRHPRFGRNELWLAEGASHRKYLVKRTESDEGHAEALFYSSYPHGDWPEVLLVDSENHIVVLQWVNNSITLQQLLQIEPSAALDRITALGPILARVHALGGGWKAAGGGIRLDAGAVPVAIAETSTLAARQVYAWIQTLTLLRDRLATPPEAERQVFVHGDIKPDNVLVVGNRTLLVDWELSGLGSQLVDVSAVVGSALLAWADAAPQSEANTLGEWLGASRIPLIALRLSLRGFLSGYEQGRRQIGARALHALADWTARWIVNRTLADATQVNFAQPNLLLRLMVADLLLEDPTLPFGLAW